MGEVLLSSIHWHIPQNTKKELRSAGHSNFSHMQSGCLKNRLFRHFDGRPVAVVNPPFIRAPLYRGALASLLEPSPTPLDLQRAQAPSVRQVQSGSCGKVTWAREAEKESLLLLISYSGRKGQKGWKRVGLLGSGSGIEKTVGYVVIICH